MFRRLCLAVAFSPRAEALLVEAAMFSISLKAHLTIVHVGNITSDEIKFIEGVLIRSGLIPEQFEIYSDNGKPTKVILSACRERNIDLLIAGALQKEKILQYYLGTIGRTILRKADCSVLMLTNPQIEGSRFANIVALAENTPYIEETVSAACQFGYIKQAKWIHVLREIKMFGLTLAASDQVNEVEYEQLQYQLVRDEIEKAEQLLNKIPHANLKINIKVMSGKAGFEVSKFSQKKNADLLVVGVPDRKFYFIDRLFSHDLEYIFANLPCNLLMVHPKQKT